MHSAGAFPAPVRGARSCRRWILPVLVLASCAVALPQTAPEPRAPSLVVVLAVDQMRADYFTRYQPHYSGGLKWLHDRGVVFENAFQNHAVTETGPGHATILTGLNPGRAGIVANQWWDRDRRVAVYCVEDPAAGILEDARAEGRSPRNLRATALGDWLKEAAPRSRVVAVGGKDRAAILLGGRSPDEVYWYSASTGRMVSSSYYLRRYPRWVEAFNSRRIAASRFGTLWDYLGPSDLYRLFGTDDVDAEEDWSPAFPHPVGRALFAPDTPYYTAFTRTPFLDSLILDFAAEAVQALRLGGGPQTDLLAVALSATDYIGHAYGPGSHEMADQLLRLDQALGEFFRLLDQTVGLHKVIIALTSDHGVAPLAGRSEVPGAVSRRLEKKELLYFQELNAHLSRTFGARERWITYYSDADLYLSWPVIARLDLRRSDVVRAARDYLQQSPLVEAVYTRDQVRQASGQSDPLLQLFRNGFHEELSGDLVVRFAEHLVPSVEPRGTTHGSPYRYDRWVPLVIYGPAWKAGRVSAEVRIIDLGPTLADAVRVAVPEGLDGRTLLGQLAGGVQSRN